MAKVATRYLEVDPWAVVEKGFHPDRGEVSESVFSLGNEHMGVRGYFEEGYSGLSMLGSYLNGVFEEGDIQHPVAWKGMATRCTFMTNTVDWLYVRLVLDGEQLDLAHSRFSEFTRCLDLRQGTLTRQFVWHVADKRLKVTFIRFVSMARRYLGCQRVILEPLNFSGELTVRSGLDFSVRQYATGEGYHAGAGGLWTVFGKQASASGGAIAAVTRRSRHRVFSAFAIQGDTSSAAPVESDQFVGVEMKLPLEQGRAASLDKLAVSMAEHRADADADEMWARGRELAQRELATTFDAALAEHTAYWRDVWDTLDLSIEGDVETEQGMRFCVFQLHQTYHGVDPSLNVAAKGLTGEVYWGATWWDTETYCLPFYMFNNPKAAQNLLGYRYQTLPAAIERAGQLDCVGARYPMATIDGTEIVGVWQHGDLQIHVSAGVAYAIWHYVHVTGDDEFLFGQGIEMLLQISRYYASRGQWSPLTGQFGFWGVMGPDEFHMMVHNNAYTNVMAKKTFEWTLRAVARMRREAPRQLTKVFRKIRLEEKELKDWRRMAAAMAVPVDRRSGLMEQFEGYFNMPHLDLDKVPPSDFPLYKNWAYVRIFRWDMVKQPDTLLLPFFFSQEYTGKQKRTLYEYYEPRCIHESSLSPSIHAILAAELGKHDEAYRHSLHAGRLDLDDYNRNTREGLHTTSMAAAWLVLVYGFGGMRSDGEVLSFNPSIPAKWQSYSFRVLYREGVLGVKVGRAAVTFTRHSGPPVRLRVFGRLVKVDERGMSVPLPADRVGVTQSAADKQAKKRPNVARSRRAAKQS